MSLRGSALANAEIFKPTRLCIFLVALFTYHGKKRKRKKDQMVLVGRRKESGRQLQYNLSIVFLLTKHMNKDTSLIEFKARNTLEIVESM